MRPMTRWEQTKLNVVNDCINACFDLKHGQWFGGVQRTSICSVQSSDVRTIAGLFRRVLKDIPEQRTIVDVGCGKGRVIQWLLSHRYPNPIVGVEIEKDVADKTRMRFASYPQVEIITGDIADCLRPEWGWFYMMNPFGGAAMGSFIRFLKKIDHRAIVCYLNVNKVNLGYLRSEFPDWQFNAMGGLNSGGRWDDLGVFVHGGSQ